LVLKTLKAYYTHKNSPCDSPRPHPKDGHQVIQLVVGGEGHGLPHRALRQLSIPQQAEHPIAAWRDEDLMISEGRITQRDEDLMISEGRITQRDEDLMISEGRITQRDEDLMISEGRITQRDEDLMISEGRITQKHPLR
uniref:Uncharacterized protein n=1 Tax=Amphiprion ocellaris TaxID=80972 RepID=A0AAQ5XP04_AMPOC